MAAVEIYIDPLCPYCARARKLLAQKGVEPEVIDVYAAPERRAEMRQRAGGKHTVPQIFIDGRHVGGCDELHALDRAGGLDPLLQPKAAP